MNKRVVGVIIKDGKILLMRRIKNGQEYLVFPGGGVEDDENLESAITREIKEEFNLNIKIDKLLFQVENRGRQEFYFLIKDFSGVPEISGPEKERINENNQYFPEWTDITKLKDIINLYPKKGVENVLEYVAK